MRGYSKSTEWQEATKRLPISDRSQFHGVVIKSLFNSWLLLSVYAPDHRTRRALFACFINQTPWSSRWEFPCNLSFRYMRCLREKRERLQRNHKRYALEPRWSKPWWTNRIAQKYQLLYHSGEEQVNSRDDTQHSGNYSSYGLRQSDIIILLLGDDADVNDIWFAERIRWRLTNNEVLMTINKEKAKDSYKQEKNARVEPRIMGKQPHSGLRNGTEHKLKTILFK